MSVARWVVESQREVDFSTNHGVRYGRISLTATLFSCDVISMKVDSYFVILGNKILYFETLAVDLAPVKHRSCETSVL
jgi:hypothetical protein